MAASTMTTFDGLLKERYIDSSKVEELMYPANVLLGMVQKKGDTDMVGDVMPVPIITANPQGVSASLSAAQGAATALATTKFQTEAGNYSGVLDISDKVIAASRKNVGA